MVVKRNISGPKSFYRKKAKSSFPVLLTPLGHKLLKAATKRTRRSRSDVIERLVREHGAQVTFVEEVASE